MRICSASVFFLSDQIWKCVAADISSNKRTQFDLLAEYEHEAGVSAERPHTQTHVCFTTLLLL